MKWFTILTAVFLLALSSCDKPDPAYLNLTPVNTTTLEFTKPDSGREVQIVEFWISSSHGVSLENIYTSITKNNSSVPISATSITAPATGFPSPATEVRISVPITVKSACDTGTYKITFTVDNRKTRNSIDYVIKVL